MGDDGIEEINKARLMCGEFSKTFNQLLTATMLVLVLIACQKLPEESSVEFAPLNPEVVNTAK